MTRHFLTSATLIAFLAAGQTTIPAGERWNHNAVVPVSSLPSIARVSVLQIAEHFVALALADSASSDLLDVTVQLEPGHQPEAIQLWTGRKNAWGSSISCAHSVANLPGLHHALVARPTDLPGADRLWIGLSRTGRRPAIGMLPLG